MSQSPQPQKEPSRWSVLLEALKHLLLHNWPTKLLALVLAVVLWAGLIMQDPTLTREKTFSNVKISITGSDAIKRNGFIVVSDLDEVLGSVSMSVDVPQMQYANAKASSYNVRIDLSRITAAGEQEIPVQASNNSVYGTVSSILPSTVRLEVEEYITRYRIPVTTLSVGTAPEGYYATEPAVDPPMIAVSGPKSLVERITRAQAVVELGNLPAREGTLRKAVPFTLLDENNNEIESDLLQITSESVLVDSVVVEQKVYSVRTILLSDLGLVRGTPAKGYEVKSVYVTPDHVTVAGLQRELDTLDVLYADSYVDVSGLSSSVNRSLRLRIPSSLPYTSANTVTVAVEIGPILRSKTFTGLDIAAEGLMDGLTCTMVTKQGAVTVTGAQLWLNELTKADVTLSCDLSGLTAGTYDVPVLCDIVDREGKNSSVEMAPQTIRVVIAQEAAE